MAPDVNAPTLAGARSPSYLGFRVQGFEVHGSRGLGFDGV